MSGRQLSDETCQLKAEELVEILKMWDIGKADAYRISSNMRSICQNTDNKDWVSPLKGSGLKLADFDIPNKNYSGKIS